MSADRDSGPLKALSHDNYKGEHCAWAALECAHRSGAIATRDVHIVTLV